MSRDATIRLGVSETTNKSSERAIELFIAGLQAELAELHEIIQELQDRLAEKEGV